MQFLSFENYPAKEVNILRHRAYAEILHGRVRKFTELVA